VKTSTFVLVVIGTLGTFGSGAVADPLGPPPYAAADAVGPYQVMNIVRASGFRPLSPPLRRGRVFWLQAMARNGEDVRIAVDASSGSIVSVAPMDEGSPDDRAASGYERAPMYEPGSPYGRSGPYHYGALEPMTSGRGSYAPPPEPAPGARSVAPIGPSVAMTPPRTPLPRPRPAETALASPSDAKIATPEAPAQASPPQAAAINKDGADQATTAEKPVEKPADKPAEKPTTTTLPPVTPLD
jgi:hypothetical protein